MLERLVLDDLTVEEKNRVLHALSLEEGGLARLDAMRASDEAILKRYPPRVMGLSLRSQLESPSAPRWMPRLLWIGVPLVAAMVGMLVVGPLTMPVQTIDPYVGVKGEPRLSATRRLDTGNEVLAPEDLVTAGDVLQLSYVAMGAAHGVVVSVDGAGVATLHWPGRGESTALQADGTTHLPQAYRLDDAPEFERFFFVTSERPIAVPEVMSAATALADGPDAATRGLSIEHAQSSLLLRKTP
jgi:hypothetical protein